MIQRVKQLLYLFICLSFLFMVFPNTAKACSCVESPSPEKALLQTEVVFRGKVMEIQESQEDNGYVTKGVLFEVLESWKGIDQSQVIIRTGSGGGDCGYPFVENAEYIVYANNSEMYGERTLTVITCSRTTEVSTGNAEEDLASLGEGVLPTVQVNLKMEQPAVQENLLEESRNVLDMKWVSIITVIIVIIVAVLIRRNRTP
ncbi:hypothetical protein [Psychrobacillus vulpis]|uniref:Tissue inhibitor of metalloproteinase n=1 Tax=Psychrobacillus vulpis TaxID=2325572 RepID=A0A544TVR1_9BACI|nr:hypothetical protein [Psychrobacillus vulpis]TQR21538.1 hypothetical protein FG384_00865 [Psychrobacillus vulpis]